MLTASILVASALGGLVAGLVALTVGGLGVLLQLRRQLSATADAVDEVALRVEREIKRRAGDARHTVPASSLGPLRNLATIPPLDDESDDSKLSRDEILRRYAR